MAAQPRVHRRRAASRSSPRSGTCTAPRSRNCARITSARRSQREDRGESRLAPRARVLVRPNRLRDRRRPVRARRSTNGSRARCCSSASAAGAPRSQRCTASRAASGPRGWIPRRAPCSTCSSMTSRCCSSPLTLVDIEQGRVRVLAAERLRAPAMGNASASAVRRERARGCRPGCRRQCRAVALAAVVRQNMRRVSTVLSTDQPLDKTQMKALRERFDEQSKSWDAGGIPILAGGLKMTSANLAAIDTSVVASLRYSNEDIARCVLRRAPASVRRRAGRRRDQHRGAHQPLAERLARRADRAIRARARAAVRHGRPARLRRDERPRRCCAPTSRRRPRRSRRWCRAAC